MKKAVLTLTILVISASFVLCMGGGAPQQETQETKDVGSMPPSTYTTQQPAEQQQQSVAPNRVDELEKVRAQVKQEKAELTKLEKYIWQLDVRMQDSRKAKNTKKLLELKELEQDAVYRARLLQNSINQKKEMYPELKVSEALEEAKTQPQPVVQRVETAPAAPPTPPTPKPAAYIVVPQVEEDITATSGNIVYHYVDIGDTFYSISRKYFGTPALYKTIAKENGFTDYSGLQQGMKLKIDLSWKNIAPIRPASPNF